MIDWMRCAMKKWQRLLGAGAAVADRSAVRGSFRG
jgi:hypothetical protein